MYTFKVGIYVSFPNRYPVHTVVWFFVGSLVKLINQQLPASVEHGLRNSCNSFKLHFVYFSSSGVEFRHSTRTVSKIEHKIRKDQVRHNVKLKKEK